MRSTLASDYQDVPRPVAVMRKDFAAGVATGRHSHPRAQLLYAASGLMMATTAGGAWAVPQGHALLIPPCLEHDVAMHGPVAMLTAYLSPEALPELGGSCRVTKVSRLLHEALAALALLPVLYDAEGRGGCLAALIADEIRLGPETPFALPLPADERLARVCRALIATPADDRGVDGWADFSGMSRRSFTRGFRGGTGLSFGEWRRRLRLVAALTRQAEGAPPRRVAAYVGYRDPRALAAMMRRTAGGEV